MRARMREEHGALLVVFSIVITVLCLMVATVVDLGHVRADAMLDQQLVDMAATAGAAELQTGFRPEQACMVAWDYIMLNSKGSAPHPCASFSAVSACDAATPPQRVEARHGMFMIAITMPVPDTLPEMNDGRANLAIDGQQCQRIMVHIRSDRRAAFGGVAANSSGSTFAYAIARAASGGNALLAPALVVLDPTGCNALTSSGQAEFRVRSWGGLPGSIAVDSSATEANSYPGRNCDTNYAIDLVGIETARVVAESGSDGTPGAIYQYALSPQGNAARAYDPTDIERGRLVPRPIAGERVTRAPWDRRYNPPESPNVDALASYLGKDSKAIPPGFMMYDGPCKTTSSTPAITLPPGDWYVPCDTFSINTTVTFQSGNVVFEKDVIVGSWGKLRINDAGTSDAYVYFRKKDFVKDAQAEVVLRRTFVLMESGRISFGAGDGVMYWTAPLGGTFRNLALWSEKDGENVMGAQANMTVEGIFFLPNAHPFKFNGQGAQHTVKAQFVVYRLLGAGQGTLIIEPDPERLLAVPAGVRLIR